MKIAVDAMGGDNAPRTVVDGVAKAIRERDSRVILVGDQFQIGDVLRRVFEGATVAGVDVHHASQTIEMGESPTTAVRTKRDASLSVAAKLVRDQRADAMFSAGNTGACMAAAMLIMGRLKGVLRPAIAVPIPQADGTTVVIDGGANVDSKPSHLAQFGIMGEVYSEQIFGIRRPRVGLLNVGEEEGKGMEVVQEAYGLLRHANLNFVGNVEGRDIATGRVDVIVCDGFVGNIVLKFAEGLAAAVLNMEREGYRSSGLRGALGAWLSRPMFRTVKRRLDPAVYGGAPLLGVNGTCIIGHGSSSPTAISNAIGVAERFVQLKVNALIRERINAVKLPKGGGTE